MTSTDIALERAIPVPARDRPKQGARVRGKLFQAIELIVFSGLPLDEAAQTAGLTTFALRNAFAKPHVLQHLKERREVLRAAACGKNILRLAEIRDDGNNMPAVNAIKLLEELGEDNRRQSAAIATPGVTIRVVTINAAPVQGNQGNAAQMLPSGTVVDASASDSNDLAGEPLVQVRPDAT